MAGGAKGLGMGRGTLNETIARPANLVKHLFRAIDAYIANNKGVNTLLLLWKPGLCLRSPAVTCKRFSGFSVFTGVHALAPAQFPTGGDVS